MTLEQHLEEFASPAAIEQGREKLCADLGLNHEGVFFSAQRVADYKRQTCPYWMWLNKEAEVVGLHGFVTNGDPLVAAYRTIEGGFYYQKNPAAAADIPYHRMRLQAVVCGYMAGLEPEPAG